MRNFIDKFNSNKKKYIVSLVVVLVLMLSLIGGTSYAILKGNVNDKNEQVIKTGSVELKLTEYYDDISKKITVMSDDDGLLQDDVYSFNIKNTGDSVAKYDLKLVNDVPSSYTGKVLDTKYIKVGLEINGDEYGPMSLDKVKNVIDSDVIYKREMLNYKLRIWLDKSKEKEIENLEDYKAFLKLKVEAVQRPESMDNGVNTKTFAYTGESQEYTVPRDGYYYIELGGGAGYNSGTANYDSNGAKTSGYVYLEAGEKLYFYVGGHGEKPNTNCRTSGYEFNGGGIAKPAAAGKCGGTGGSATDVRLVGGSWDDTKSLISRIMVAGGGGYGDQASNYTLGYGGTLYGTKTLFATYQQYLSNPGTQISGGVAPTKYSGAQSTGDAGSFGKGGAGGASPSGTSSGGGSGGGSGYYGASGSSGLSSGSWASSGGSSYISGYAGVNSVKESTTITHTNQTIHYSGKYFVGGDMIEGQNAGNGYAKISYVDSKPKRRNTKLNNVRYIKDCTNYNTANNANHWLEIEAIKDGVNIAKGKSVTGTTSQSSSYPYSRITDGDITYANWANPSSYSNNQCVTVDLGSTYDLDEVAVWNYFGSQRSYYNSKTSVSADNSTFTDVIDDASIQTSNGRRINAYATNYNGYTSDKLLVWHNAYANNGDARNSSTTTWKNLASSSYNATTNGTTWYGNYLSFDGTNDYVTLSNLGNSFPATYSFVYKTNSAANQIIFGYNSNSAGIGIYGNGLFITSLKTSSNVYDTGGITLDKFYKVDVIYRSLSDKTIYVNGEKIAKTSDTNYWSWGDSNSYLGRRSSGTYFKGGIASFQVFGRELSEDEIIHNYNYDKQKFNLE